LKSLGGVLLLKESSLLPPGRLGTPLCGLMASPWIQRDLDQECGWETEFCGAHELISHA
jgi:hypothetical protein